MSMCPLSLPNWESLVQRQQWNNRTMSEICSNLTLKKPE